MGRHDMVLCGQLRKDKLHFGKQHQGQSFPRDHFFNLKVTVSKTARQAKVFINGVSKGVCHFKSDFVARGGVGVFTGYDDAADFRNFCVV